MIDWSTLMRTPPLPAEPTKAGPGTAEKVEIMVKRHAQGKHIHHPLDLRVGGEDGLLYFPIIAKPLKRKGSRWQPREVIAAIITVEEEVYRGWLTEGSDVEE